MVIGEAQAVESREPASPSASGRTPEHEVGDEMLSGGEVGRGRENVVDGCALSAPSCTTRGARRPRAPA